MIDDTEELSDPWLIAVWPGMGNVGLSAGYYLMAKLGMELLAEYSPPEYFDVDHVDVKRGLIRTGVRPRSRFFLWKDPRGKHDLVVLIGEAQPQFGKYSYCQKLIAYAQNDLGIQRVLTFAAMATAMHPDHESRVFSAVTDVESLDELKQWDLNILEEGNISGLNGILLGAAADKGLKGTCLLGEMPHVFSQLPFPKASLAVLESFKLISGIDIDTTELAEQGKEVEQRLGELLSRVEQSMGEQQPESYEEAYQAEPPEEPKLTPEEEQNIENLFAQAEQDRSKAYELKQELDRLDLFKDYEDRFLDLFKNNK
ncbi:PAC2 family protein [Gimesia alba]|uniref:PAC2 family protein n=1 Tax=Gimesia alba TaxID=2527973 RepID=A0A517RJ01_9PLAN|nr:PAC2 family protein [Gimesia alba]QDT43843.1 PAC2 family protein [Gimesia alba]